MVVKNVEFHPHLNKAPFGAMRSECIHTRHESDCATYQRCTKHGTYYVLNTASATTKDYGKYSSYKSLIVLAICTFLLIGLISLGQALISRTEPLDLSILDEQELSLPLRSEGIADLKTNTSAPAPFHSPKDVLELDLDIYNHDVSSFVPAIAYAGAKSSTIESVQKITSIDKNITQEIRVILVCAQYDKQVTKEEISEAITLLERAENSLSSNLVLIEEDEKTYATILQGQQDMANRYRSMKALLNLAKDPEGVTLEEINYYNQEVYKSTKRAGDTFKEALNLS